MQSIIFSPHCDDAFFSLGGAILQGSLKPAIIYNFFCQTNWTIRSIGQVNKITQIRIKEDQRLYHALNCQTYYLMLEDACLRIPKNDDDTQYLDPYLIPQQQAIWQTIKNIVKNIVSTYTDSRLFFPLGLGNHIDHRLIFEAGKQYCHNPNVYFYEDTPYDQTLNNQVIKKHLINNHLNVISQTLKISLLEQKISLAKKYYKSQINSQVYHDIQTIGINRGGERIWGNRKKDLIN